MHSPWSPSVPVRLSDVLTERADDGTHVGCRGLPAGLDQGSFGGGEMERRGEPGPRVTVRVGIVRPAEHISGAVGLRHEAAQQLGGRAESAAPQGGLGPAPSPLLEGSATVASTMRRNRRSGVSATGSVGRCARRSAEDRAWRTACRLRC